MNRINVLCYDHKGWHLVEVLEIGFRPEGLVYVNINCSRVSTSTTFTAALNYSLRFSEVFGWGMLQMRMALPLNILQSVDWNQFQQDLEECFITNNWNITLHEVAPWQVNPFVPSDPSRE